jgi:hypothetical protein
MVLISKGDMTCIYTDQCFDSVIAKHIPFRIHNWQSARNKIAFIVVRQWFTSNQVCSRNVLQQSGIIFILRLSSQTTSTVSLTRSLTDLHMRGCDVQH